MRNCSFRKIMVFGTILLCVWLNIIPIGISEKVDEIRIITVDDEVGDGDYTSIKEALNISNPGDTIEVYSGIFYDNDMVIQKDRVTLKGISHELGNGSDIGMPIIYGTGSHYILMVDNAQNVTISGFCMKNDEYDLYIVLQDAIGCIISDNSINDETTGNHPFDHNIRNSLGGCIECCYYSKDCKIVNNTIRQNHNRSGIFITSTCEYFMISDNVISDADIGILFYGKYSIIMRNRISGCKNYGITLLSSRYNTVSYNNLTDNPVGVNLSFSQWNKIEMNNFIDNQDHAQFFQGGFGDGFPGFNRWNNNYWGQPRMVPYLIQGYIFRSFHWCNIDWHPAQEPYTLS